MYKFTRYIWTLLSIALICSCNFSTNKIHREENDKSLTGMKYANNINIQFADSFTLVQLSDPWHSGRILHQYILVPSEHSLPTKLPQGTLIRTPIRKAIINPAMHCHLFEELGAHDIIAGICEPEYVKVPRIEQDVRSGKIINCGSSMSPDIEKIIQLHPDAIFVSPFENNGGYGRLGKLNIPIIECADYMETSPLGRAEWMKFYGLLCGRYEQAQTLFSQIETEYQDLSRKALNTSERPTVITELKTGSVWYIPGGHSTTGQILNHAGAKYVFSDLKNSGSRPLSFETVFSKAKDARFWLFKYNQKKDKTLSELQTDLPMYRHFRAFTDMHVYGCNTHYSLFYEETPFHPERLLKDLVKIFHPELLPNYQLKYYSRLSSQ